ncbi:hypothetical protein K0M31_010987 [Melipona bicolor]|uniref:Uncharacterized protein n=1 Tax=Melipona bicolor TaxID=60889 RepID=A0AA40FKF5_9HYME|nr:hypothetical protein K0M31_010987 [Melipona bicolor]
MLSRTQVIVKRQQMENFECEMIPRSESLASEKRSKRRLPIVRSHAFLFDRANGLRAASATLSKTQEQEIIYGAFCKLLDRPGVQIIRVHDEEKHDSFKSTGRD